MLKKIKKAFPRPKKKNKETEYHKRVLSSIIINCIAMMWCSYILAFCDKTAIAETLSTTIASTIVGVTIPYLITKTVENVSKYGCRLNNTAISQDEKRIEDEEAVG